MRGRVTSTGRGIAVAGLLGCALAGGCSPGGAPAPFRATVESCYAFGVRALQRHVTVTTVPRACAGLSHAQVNLAVARAVREVAGPGHKAAARRRASREGGYLAHLINTVPPGRPRPVAVAPARAGSDLPLSLAALAAWVVTAAAGGYLLAGWLAHGGWRSRHIRAAGLPPLVILGHAGLAAAGLAIWIAFLASGVPALAWTAVGVILLVAGLGMATLVTGLPEPADSTASAAPAKMRMPWTVIAAHGVLATATIMLVLLAAIGA